MSTPLVVITDYGFSNLHAETRILEAAGARVVACQAKTADAVVEAARQADALLVQWAPITRPVIEKLERCKVIVRYGIGVDNVDLQAAQERKIPVCNVPDYCIDEVADHTLALALALARQLPAIAARVKSGTWKITPERPMPAFREMLFATVGLGRIARSVLQRASAFGFQLGACDPFAPDTVFARQSCRRLSLDELFESADVISLHSPLTPETRHLVNAARLHQMKRTAILVNTARGGLIDTVALAEALRGGKIAAAGLDVFESEPLPPDHPLRACENALLTSHVAWYSESSVPQLQQLAAQEVVRALQGQPLKNPVHP